MVLQKEVTNIRTADIFGRAIVINEVNKTIGKIPAGQFIRAIVLSSKTSAELELVKPEYIVKLIELMQSKSVRFNSIEEFEAFFDDKKDVNSFSPCDNCTGICSTCKDIIKTNKGDIS